MGIFDLFKPKELTFNKQSIIDGPDYLKGKFQDIPDPLLNRFRILENEYTWTRQLKTGAGTKFSIKYFGDIRKTWITSKDGLPQIVTVTDQDNNELLLFDGAKHGYNAVFWQEFPEEIKHRQVSELYKKDEESKFEIVVLVRYSLSLKDEFDEEFQQEGFVENNRREKLGKEAFSNGYDSIQVFAFGPEGRGIEVLAEETA